MNRRDSAVVGHVSDDLKMRYIVKGQIASLVTQAQLVRSLAKLRRVPDPSQLPQNATPTPCRTTVYRQPKSGANVGSHNTLHFQCKAIKLHMMHQLELDTKVKLK